MADWKVRLVTGLTNGSFGRMFTTRSSKLVSTLVTPNGTNIQKAVCKHTGNLTKQITYAKGSQMYNSGISSIRSYFCREVCGKQKGKQVLSGMNVYLNNVKIVQLYGPEAKEFFAARNTLKTLGYHA